MYCDHCQTTVVEGASFCQSCGGRLASEPGSGATAASAADAPTVALTVGPCESCGAPSLPGSTLCLPCTRAFESILKTPAPPLALPGFAVSVPAAPPAAAPVPSPAAPDSGSQAPALPSAPGSPFPHPQDALTIAVPAPIAAAAGNDDEDDDYEDDDEDGAADDLMAEESATVLATPPAAAAPPPAVATLSTSPDWTLGEETVVAIAPWARKGPDGEIAVDETEAAAAPEPPAAEPVPWWERHQTSGSGTNGTRVASGTTGSPARAESARYVPPPTPPPPVTSLESSIARQAMRPKVGSLATAAPVIARTSSRRTSLLVVAGLAAIAAIGSPIMWKLAFASKPTVVSARRPVPAAAATTTAAAPRPERVHGPAPEPARVYEDLLPLPAPVKPAAAAATASPTHQPAALPRPGARKPLASAESAAAPMPEPAPLLAATAPAVAAAPAPAPPTPAPAAIAHEAVPLGQIYEVSQVDSRPQVTSRFDPVLPARLQGQAPVVVIVRVLVSPSGRAAEARAVKNPTNDEGLSAAASATVRQWSYAPAKKRSAAVSCWFNVGVVFKAASGD